MLLKKKRQYPEHVLVKQYLKWLFYQHRTAYQVAYTIPNEGKRSFIAASNLNKGIPDFCLPIGNKQYSALYIEFKIKPNKPSEEQLVKIELLKNAGNQALVCYNLEDAMKATDEYLKDVSFTIHQSGGHPLTSGN